MVDIGVGEQQCGAAGCMDCHSVQINPNDPEQLARATEEELKVYWFKGEFVDESKRHREKLDGTVR